MLAKLTTIPIVIIRRILLRMGFGVEEKLLRKKRILRTRRFVEKFEKYFYYNWTLLSNKQQKLIREHYKK